MRHVTRHAIPVPTKCWKCIDEGMTVIDHSEIDTDAFREAAKASYEQLGLTDTYNEIMSALGK